MSKTRILFRLIGFTAHYKAQIFVLILLGFIMVGFSVLQPLPIKYIIDNVLSNHKLPGVISNAFKAFGIVPDKVQLLIFLVAASVMMVISTSLLSYISTHITTKVCQRLVYDFSATLFDKL